MKAQFNILIVEDERLIAEMLKEMLYELGYHVAGIAKNYAEAMQWLNSFSQQLDMVILDIHLSEEKTGIDIGKVIAQKYQIPFIYLTSHSDTATIRNATSTMPSSYLIKPFQINDIFATIEIVRARKQDDKVIVFKDGHLRVKLPVNQINYIKSDNNYVEIHSSTKKYLIRNSLDQFLSELSSSNFIRVHRSYAVNTLKIEAVNGKFIILSGQKIPLSRKHREQVLRQFSK